MSENARVMKSDTCIAQPPQMYMVQLHHIGEVHGGGGGEGELSYWEGSWRRWWRR